MCMGCGSHLKTLVRLLTVCFAAANRATALSQANDLHVYMQVALSSMGVTISQRDGGKIASGSSTVCLSRFATVLADQFVQVC